MKKYVIFWAVSFVLGSAVHALKPEVFEEALDKWEGPYPILSKAREDRVFKSALQECLKENQDDKVITPQLLLQAVLKKVMPIYISSSHHDFVEGLDPVWRDVFGLEPMKLTLPTTNNCYKVHHIFNK